MFRTLKRLIGIWEPREGVVYKSKDRLKRKDGIVVSSIVECFTDGSWQECNFIFEKGKYHVFGPKLNKYFVIDKEICQSREEEVRYSRSR